MSHRYKLYHVENIANIYVINIFVWWQMTSRLTFWNVEKYWITVLCAKNEHSAVGQLYIKNKETYRKRDQMCGYQMHRGSGEEELDEDSQKVQTSRYI